MRSAMYASLPACISASRSFAMGLAMIAIMLFHLPYLFLPVLPFRYFGFWGVDVFIFLSGYGIYHSLRKSGSVGLCGFYQRRLLRIMPSAIIAGCLLLLFEKHSPIESFLSCCGLSLWYIRSILALYLASPLIYRFTERLKASSGWRITGFLALWEGIYLSLYLLLRQAGYLPELPAEILLWTMARFPAYLAGMCLAGGKWLPVHRWWYYLIAVAGVAIAAMGRILQMHLQTDFYVLDFMTVAFLIPALPLFLFAVAKIRSFAPSSLAVRAVTWAGVFSLEIYVCHEGIYRWFTAHVTAHKAVLPAIAAIACSLFAAWGVAKAADGARWLLQRRG